MFHYIGNRKGRTVHLWLEEVNDTACAQWSTGGIRDKDDYRIFPSAAGKHVCKICNQYSHHLDRRIAKLKSRRATPAAGAGHSRDAFTLDEARRMNFFRQI